MGVCRVILDLDERDFHAAAVRQLVLRVSPGFAPSSAAPSGSSARLQVAVAALLAGAEQDPLGLVVVLVLDRENRAGAASSALLSEATWWYAVVSAAGGSVPAVLLLAGRVVPLPFRSPSSRRALISAAMTAGSRSTCPA
ncbi:hypothetical protein HBB16_14575 [Pseudonocardia sp. MCCB 268]|nr:hypothetical protein [Pseudonocardia cytotoxica]